VRYQAALHPDTLDSSLEAREGYQSVGVWSSGVSGNLAGHMRHRVGIIGCGNISDTYFGISSKFADLEVVACTDMDEGKARAQGEKYGVRVLTLEEILGSDVTALVNLTPPAAHAEVTLRALEAGKHVYTEKPLAVSFEDGLRIRDVAMRRGLRVGSAPDTFMGAGLQTSRALLEAGAIGQPLNAFASMTSRGPEGWHPNPFFFFQPGAGPLFDMGPYYITALVHFFGGIQSVTASARKSRETRVSKSGEQIPVNTPTHVSANLEFASGVIVTLLVSFDMQHSTLPRFELYGSSGTLLAPDPNTFNGDVQVRTDAVDGWVTEPLTRPYQENSRGLGLADMMRAIAQNRAHRASLELSLHVLETMHAVLRSAETGQRVHLETTTTQPAMLEASETF
jgi:predicted dehydrogenase